MKTYLKYGGAMAGGGFVIVLALYAFGLHADPAGLKTAQWIQGILGLAVAITCIVLGTKERRAQAPATEEFGYGAALGAGVMITLVAAVIGIFTTLLYAGVINPGLTDVMLRAQAEGLEARGLSADRIEQIQKASAMFMKPAVQACLGFVMGMIFGTIISLITAAFLKRSGSDLPPVQT